MKVTRKNNGNGTYSYSLNGVVIRKTSKKIYEYAVVFANSVPTFGKLKTCEYALSRCKSTCTDRINWYNDVIKYAKHISNKRPILIKENERDSINISEYEEGKAKWQRYMEEVAILKIEDIDTDK